MSTTRSIEEPRTHVGLFPFPSCLCMFLKTVSTIALNKFIEWIGSIFSLTSNVMKTINGVFLVFFCCSSAILVAQPLQNRLLIATSTDGLHFTKQNKTLYEYGDVPDAVVTDAGKVYAYFQGIIEPQHDIIVVGISQNGIDGWSFQSIRISGTENWRGRPCDPDVIYRNGIFRLYFTGDPTNDQIPETYSAVSGDGIDFTLENGVRFSGGSSAALDPSLLWIGDTLHYFAGGKAPSLNWHAVSTDGLQFSKLDDFSANGLMMSNGIPMKNGYRFYGFQNTPPQKIRSLFTANGETWMPDAGIRLELDPTNILEAVYVKDPAVVFKDSIYIMYYVTRKKEFTSVINDLKYSPMKFDLRQNHPNPFSDRTTIQIPTDQEQRDDDRITLKVFDLFGREVLDVSDEARVHGQVVIRREQLPGSGMYFYRAANWKPSIVKAMTLR